MPTYVIALDESRSGTPVEVEDGTAIPSPAVVQVRREGESLAYELRIEHVAGAWPVVTELRVQSTNKPLQGLTAARLRDIKFGQLQRACVSYLRRGPFMGLRWPEETFTLFEDPSELGSWMQKVEDARWSDLLPDVILDERPDAKWAVRPDPAWLARVKEGGVKSELALRTTAAIYRMAVKDGHSPNSQVERFLELPKSTASEWIKKARAHGFLEKSPRKTRADKRKSDA